MPLRNHNDNTRIRMYTLLIPVCFPSMVERKRNNILTAVRVRTHKVSILSISFYSSLSAYTQTRTPLPSTFTKTILFCSVLKSCYIKYHSMIFDCFFIFFAVPVKSLFCPFLNFKRSLNNL